MTVAEEVARAVQIASAPQEVANSIPPTAEEVANSSAARAPSTSLPSHISSSTDTVTIQRSPAFLPKQLQWWGGWELFWELELYWRLLLKFYCIWQVYVSSGVRKAKEAGRKNLVKRKRPRDAQSERTVTCTDCGVQLHWASLAQHRKKHHVKESGTSNTEGGYEQIVRLFYDLTWCPQVWV